MVKIGVCGHFGKGLNLLNGQTIKTKIITTELERQYGKAQVCKVDTHGGIKRVPGMVLDTIKLFIKCENIIIFPAYKGLQLYSPMCVALNALFHRRVHYVVIGGWLAGYLEKHKSIEKQLKKFTGIYVETSVMEKALENKGFQNIFVMPNAKALNVLKKDEIKHEEEQPYKLCTFSRVMREKGIEDAIETVKRINQTYGEVVYTLDIYGQIEAKYENEFIELQEHFPEYISYRGKVAFDQSVDVLKDYFALLFPTQFYTEGIPGTIIDAYAAGIPVISSKWESFSDVIDEAVTGLGYDFSDNEGLERILLKCIEKPEIIFNMKYACITKAEMFKVDNVVKILALEK